MLTPRILTPVRCQSAAGGTGGGAAIGGPGVDNGVGSGGTGTHGISIGGRGMDSGVGAGGTGVAAHGISIGGRGGDSGGTGVVVDVWGTGVGIRGVLERTWETGVGTDAIPIGGRDAAKSDYIEAEFEAERRGSADVVGSITYLSPDSANKPSTREIPNIIWGWGGNAVGGGEVGTDAITVGGRGLASGKDIQFDTVSSLLMTTE
ncbi:hypothetical protein C8J57DRAFT_1396128 [Mycena rebaudengoi]|nr:hypothetical protein C8J57DRAFT_1396128 [Mycena rebaudengoi]